MDAWTIVLPVKPFEEAKSRLGSLSGSVRATLAEAFFQDTLLAVLSTAGVQRVLVVTQDQRAAGQAAAAGAFVLPDHPRAGLNAAVRRATAWASADAPDRPTAVLTTDLPSLRSTELQQVLTEAAGHRVSFLADHSRQGTTFLAATRPNLLTPCFEGHSSHAHRLSGAHEITEVLASSVRLDVDTLGDLELAQLLGLGHHTDSALRSSLGTSTFNAAPLQTAAGLGEVVQYVGAGATVVLR
ncbi:2-phospho-L-lactate guanylyltransferase [Streptomyces sp. NPDC021080]|uniref:2-phospho-L-lactate guanylyltransferase n=1 Tax=Streptomyces sp. NPDC021080 TaxID=3365110 RepID=UPI003787E6F9